MKIEIQDCLELKVLSKYIRFYLKLYDIPFNIQNSFQNNDQGQRIMTINPS